MATNGSHVDGDKSKSKFTEAKDDLNEELAKRQQMKTRTVLVTLILTITSIVP